MTFLDVPDAAVKAAIDARYDHGTDPMPYHTNRCRCGATFATAVQLLEHATRRELEAALRHLPAAIPQPVERPYEQTLDESERRGD